MTILLFPLLALVLLQSLNYSIFTNHFPSTLHDCQQTLFQEACCAGSFLKSHPFATPRNLVLLYRINTHLSERRWHGKELPTETSALKCCLLTVNKLAGEVISSATYGVLEMGSATFLQVASPQVPAVVDWAWNTHYSVSFESSSFPPHFWGLISCS